jgi:hypothetical protein
MSSKKRLGAANQLLLFPQGEALPKSRGPSSAASASAVFSSITTGGLHEFLDPSGSFGREDHPGS